MWIAVNQIETPVDFNNVRSKEVMFQFKPDREGPRWFSRGGELTTGICLPEGTIEKLTGKKMTWTDEAVEILKIE